MKEKQSSFAVDIFWLSCLIGSLFRGIGALNS
jgi:hypothetical protein